MKKRKKYNYGTGIESPQTTLTKNAQAIAQAELESTNGLTDALDIIGNLAMNAGSSMLMKGLKNKGLDKKIDNFLPGAQIEYNEPNYMDASLRGKGMYAALGGTVPVEVEGGESANLPNGSLIEFEGPSHSKGGIDVDLPSGTDIFSDRISIDGMTMGERNAYRSKKLKKLSSLAGDSVADKNTFERTQQSFAIDEENDLLVQSLVKASKGGASKQKMALGGKIRDWVGGLGDNILGSLDGLTAGDLLGMYSTFRKGQAGLQNTNAHRAGQTPNINPFENYGQNSLDTLDNAMQYSDDILAQNIADIQGSSLNLRSRNRATARGVNTNRALDIASSVAEQKAINEAYQGNRSTTMDMLTRKSSLQADIDSKVMSGEAMRDENNRNDYDAYFSNRGKDLQSFFEGLTQIGGQFNRLKERDIQGELINSLSKYFDVDINTGKLTKKQS